MSLRLEVGLNEPQHKADCGLKLGCMSMNHNSIAQIKRDTEKE